jgi:outer membrane murein-binding lipoprotein Lpp
VGWVVGGTWIGAGVLALLVLGFCAYELSWKIRRLRREGARMQALAARAQTLQGEVAALQQRAAQLD